jgi:hypothetical protein
VRSATAAITFMARRRLNIAAVASQVHINEPSELKWL